MSEKTWPKRRGSVKQSTDVRYLDRGYPIAEVGNSNYIGLTPSYTTTDRPDIKDTPANVLIYNTEKQMLEISCPEEGRWVEICCSGSIAMLGYPSDGTYSDGALPLNPSGTIAEAIDEINEYLVGTGVITLASHLGTTDGTTNGILIDPSFNIGRVSSPTSVGNPFYTNSWDNDTNRDLSNDSTINWSLGVGESITDLQTGTITARFYGQSGLLHTETLNPDGTSNDQQSLPNGYIEISNLTTLGSRKEGHLSISVSTIAILGGSNSGYLRVEVDHVVPGSGTFTNAPIEFFKDSANSPSMNTQSGTLISTPELFLSGIKFATISGSLKPIINISLDVSDLWKDTYRADPIVVQSSDYGIPNYTISYNSTSVTKGGISPPAAPFRHDDDFIYSENKEITEVGIINPDINGNLLTIDVAMRDPFNSVVSTGLGTSPPLLINTYQVSSTDVLELFVDEDYRLKDSASGTGFMTSINGLGRGTDAWDSTQSLLVNNALQVYNRSLIYPQDDFSQYSPAGNPNYSSLAAGVGDLTYRRRFRDTLGTARTNGVLFIDGMSESDRTSGDISIDIRVVGTHIIGNGTQGVGNEGTGWLSLNSSYNFATFKGDDGDGCFTTLGSYSAPYFEFTLGSFSTAYAFNQAIEILITYKDPTSLSKKINRVEIINWNP